ncbi:MAG: Gfo/Idh/MocA family oxidoreductase, partial [Candidatus Hydrogenedentes bacterium]|nr:Gfo/Idh/MocA family oxidoreductase [Candidatus Hydrogenedentota bacterium]
GVVGGGFGSAFHWHQHPNCTVEAVSDLIPERRDHLMRTYSCAKTYESLEKLILDPAVEAVALFTGAPDHPRHTVLCMEAGKHVISACPACMTLEDAATLKDVKERTGLTYMTAETSYYRWETITARRMHAAGLFGELVYTEAEYYHPMNQAERDALWYRDGQRTWRYGFAPMLYPTHSTAFLVGVTGERLTKVSSIGWGDDDPALKDNVYGNPFFNETGMFLTNKNKPFRCNVGWKLNAHGERAQWFGTKASLYSAGSGGQPYVMQLPDKHVMELPDYFQMLPEPMRKDTGHGASHPFLTNEFIAALLEQREPATNIYEALAYCVPGIVAHESSKKGGEQLAIPSFDKA